MATLSDADRAAIWRHLMRIASAREDALPLLKTDLRAAVDAADQWVEDNATAYNTALPLPARTALTAAQKSELLTAVMRKRFGDRLPQE